MKIKYFVSYAYKLTEDGLTKMGFGNFFYIKDEYHIEFPRDIKNLESQIIKENFATFPVGSVSVIVLTFQEIM